MSKVLFHIRHGRALSPVLAVPAVPIEENEVRIPDLSDRFFDAEDTLHGGAFAAHLAGILFGYPYPPLDLRFHLASGLFRPPFYRQRNSFVIQHLDNPASEYLRV